MPNAKVEWGAELSGVFEEDWGRGSTAVVPAYSASRIAMPGLTLSVLHIRQARDSIAIHDVCGWVRTDMRTVRRRDHETIESQGYLLGIERERAESTKPLNPNLNHSIQTQLARSVTFIPCLAAVLILS